jgi:hypothetical protein
VLVILINLVRIYTAKTVKEFVLNVVKDTVHRNSTCSYQVTRARIVVLCETCHEMSKKCANENFAAPVTK